MPRDYVFVSNSDYVVKYVGRGLLPFIEDVSIWFVVPHMYYDWHSGQSIRALSLEVTGLKFRQSLGCCTDIRPSSRFLSNFRLIAISLFCQVSTSLYLLLPHFEWRSSGIQIGYDIRAFRRLSDVLIACGSFGWGVGVRVLSRSLLEPCGFGGVPFYFARVFDRKAVTTSLSFTWCVES